MAYDEHDLEANVDPSLQNFDQIPAYIRSGRLPLRRNALGGDDELIIADDCAPNRPFPLRRSHAASQLQFDRMLRKRFDRELSDYSRNALLRIDPSSSAHRLLSFGQKLFVSVAIIVGAIIFASAPAVSLIAVNIVITGYFLAAIAFRAYLTFLGFDPPAPSDSESLSPPSVIADGDLPVITILLPVYDEAESLPLLRAAMAAIDYPPRLLDIKLILEADDAATINEAQRLGLDETFDFVIVPASDPRTKPKACNHGLYLARGDLIVIYDAEDAPAPDQLRKAAAAFAGSDDQLACLQARLNYYNADENWLTRLFAIEYALWFDTLLPALEQLAMPIPLGGTSNFIRTKTLIELGGWDPYNVTEDADLGLRLARRGYRTEVLDTTTFEEANCKTDNWIRQRSRWMKGYMQTWLVQMRAPAELIRAVGWRGFAAMNLFVAGNFLSALINPFLWVVFVVWLTTRTQAIGEFFPGPLLALNLFALLFGNAMFIYLGMIAPLKRGWPELSPHALLAPAYWCLTSLAAYRALWQLLTRPSYWEKTRHVLSAVAQEKRRRVLMPGAAPR